MTTSFSRSFGDGPRAGLAIHCTLGHSGGWRGVGQALSRRMTLTAYDLPGHGRSPDWDGKGDLHSRCRDMALPFLTRPVDVIGHSFGATVALRLAVEHPEKVRTLTLIEPVYFAVLKAEDPQALQDHADLAAPYEEALAAGDPALSARLFNRIWGDGTKWPDFPETARSYMINRMHIVPDQSPMIFDDNAGLMEQGALARAAMPSVLLRGSQSPEVTASINRGLARRLPHAHEITIEGAGHMAPLTHPRAVADIVADLSEMA